MPKRRRATRGHFRSKVGRARLIHGKPSKAQIAKGALSTLALAVPLGTLAAAGLSAADGYVAATGKGWSPPVIGWRGVSGLALLGIGALTRSPVLAASGGVLFGSSIPSAVRSLGNAMSIPVLPDGGFVQALKAAGDPTPMLGAEYEDDEDDEDDEDEDVAADLSDALDDAISAGAEEFGDGQE
jgi:hypothetical protein